MSHDEILRSASLAARKLHLLSPREIAEAQRYQDSLTDFTKRAWRYVDGNPYLSGWHIDAITEHLEACANWEITKLLINIPPRHMKSMGANVFFPAWIWAQNPNPMGDPDYEYQIAPNSWRGPGVKFMHLSYEAGLATRDGVKCRRIMQSDWYQRFWGHRFQMVHDDNLKTRFSNLQGGHRISTSETGVITGEGGDIIIFDDPHNARKMTDPVREATLLFWDEAMPSRLNDQKHGVFIVIMQRLHERDLAGHILARELGWTHLCLPAMAENDHPFPIKTTVKRKSTGEIWTDPRKVGEALWEAKFDLAGLERMAKDDELNSHMAAGQLQQRPTAREGGMFKRDWFANPVRFAPEDLRKVRAWDFASSAEGFGDPDYTVGVLMGYDVKTQIYYVLDVIRRRVTPGQREQLVKSTALLDGETVRIRIPQDPGGAGKFEAHHFASILDGFSVAIEPETTSKEDRANSLVSRAEFGFLKLVEAPWNQAFIDELCAFPNGAHDDQVDAATAAYRALVRRGTVNLVAA